VCVCVHMVTPVWGVGGVSFGNDPVGKQPKLLNLCIATPNSYSLSNRLSPSVFLSCFILYLLLFSTSVHPFQLAFFNRSWLLWLKGYWLLSPTHPSPLIQHEHNTRRACISFEDSASGSRTLTACHDGSATPLPGGISDALDPDWLPATRLRFVLMPKMSLCANTGIEQNNGDTTGTVHISVLIWCWTKFCLQYSRNASWNGLVQDFNSL
jgi:hypothetical protein